MYFYLFQNNLTGSLPASLPNLPNARGLYLSLCDNLLSGTIPATWRSTSFTLVTLSWRACYCPHLLSPVNAPPLPHLLLQAHPPSGDGLTPPALHPPTHSNRNPLLVGTIPTGLAPWNAHCSGSTLGSSLGLDKPLPYLLGLTIRPQLDPTSAALLSWNPGASLQPCPPYSGQPQGRPGYGGSYAGISCTDTTTGMTFTMNLYGGNKPASGLLTGSIPTELRELRTMTYVELSYNQLGGTLPQSWGQNVTWANFPTPTPGFDQCTQWVFYVNSLSGPLPPLMGNMPRAASAYFRIIDNNFTGTVPAGYSAFGSGVSIAYNPNLFGPLPWNVVVYPESVYYNYAWRSPYLYGTSIGMDRPMALVLADIKAAANPGGSALSGWQLGVTSQPCMGWSSATAGRPTTGLYPSGFTPGITCNDVYSGPALTRVAYGGIAGLSLANTALGGQLPVQLRELRTASTIDFTCALGPSPPPSLPLPSCVDPAAQSLPPSHSSFYPGLPLPSCLASAPRSLTPCDSVLRVSPAQRHRSNTRLSGTIPSVWGQSVAWTTFPTATPGFDIVQYLYFAQNNVCAKGSPLCPAAAQSSPCVSSSL